MRMKDQVAIVTGAASGIGKTIATRYAAEGARVAIADLDMDKAQAAAEEINGNDGQAMAVKMDVTDENAVDEGVQQVVDQWGRVDVLVSNAGIQHIDRIENLSFADWRKVTSIHCAGCTESRQ